MEDHNTPFFIRTVGHVLDMFTTVLRNNPAVMNLNRDVKFTHLTNQQFP